MRDGLQEFSYSVIIPTLNEERHIAAVIDQFNILNGRFAYEVIIGDGGSTDNTREIAARLGARVAIDTGAVKTVASGRNIGASVAKGDILIFCDADTLLSDVVKLIRSAGLAFRDPEVVAAVPKMEVFPEQQIWKDRVFHRCFNALIKTSFKMPSPLSRGQCQIIRTSAFRSVGGYNAMQVHADDNTIFQHLAKIGKLRFIDDVTVFESPRRYRKYGYLKLSAIGVYSIVGQSILKRNILSSWERVD